MEERLIQGGGRRRKTLKKQKLCAVSFSSEFFVSSRNKF